MIKMIFLLILGVLFNLLGQVVWFDSTDVNYFLPKSATIELIDDSCTYALVARFPFAERAIKIYAFHAIGGVLIGGLPESMIILGTDTTIIGPDTIVVFQSGNPYTIEFVTDSTTQVYYTTPKLIRLKIIK